MNVALSNSSYHQQPIGSSFLKLHQGGLPFNIYFDWRTVSLHTAIYSIL